jgi:outer membrane receptor protein involved in Fe transport
MTITTALLAVSAGFAPLQQDSLLLPDTVIQLGEVVVSGTRSTAVPRLEGAASLSLTVPQADLLGAGVIAADLLRDVPGTFVQQTSAGQGAVILRGLVGNQVLYLVDGVPMNNGTYRDGPGQYFATIDPELVDRVEVVRGPASVLYGSDAQGGVVNVQTRSSPSAGSPSMRIAGSYSSADQGLRGRASLGFRGSIWRLGLGASVVSTGDLRAGGEVGKQVPTGFNAEGADLDFSLMPNDRHALDVVLQHFSMHGVPRYDRYVTFRAPAPGRDAEHLFEPQTRQLAYARYAFTPHGVALSTLEATLSLSTQYEGRSRVRLQDTGDPADSRTLWRDDVYTPGISLVGTSMASLANTAVMLTWGADYYHDQLSSEGRIEEMSTGMHTELTRQTADGEIATGNFPDGANADRVGVFLNAETSVTDWLLLTLGARWSGFRNRADVGTELGGYVENTSSDLTGQLGVVVAPAPAWRIAARLAEGFRAPNLYDLTRAGPVPGGVALPNPDATPEKSLSGELSLRYQTNEAAFDVTGYYTRITDFIDRVPGEFQGDTMFYGERVFQGRNVGTARLWGIEAQAAKAFGPVQIDATLLYTFGEQEPPGPAVEPMSKIPPLNGHVAMRWTSPERPVWVEYLLRWATRQDRLGTRDLDDPRIPKPDGTPGFAVHGFRAGWTVAERVTLSAGLENVLDELYRNHASGVDNAGRHVWLGVSWTGAF